MTLLGFKRNDRRGSIVRSFVSSGVVVGHLRRHTVIRLISTTYRGHIRRASSVLFAAFHLDVGELSFFR